MGGKPFDGAISKFYKSEAPPAIRAAIKNGKKGAILSDTYPYPERLDGDDYRRGFDALQIEMVKMQSWARDSGARVVVVVEGRDAAGKGGSIKRMRENLNPRGARVVALAKPTEREAGQWYFQRYIEHMPTAGEIVFFDRSWYNRVVVERVFGFSTPAERETFFRQAPDFEAMLVQDGVRLFKLWLTIGRAEQLRRFLDRERDLLKQWKLSEIDIKSLGRWDLYTEAIAEMFTRTHSAVAPWTVIRADDKRRARLAAMQVVLSGLDYAEKDPAAVGVPDIKIVGGPDDMPVLGG